MAAAALASVAAALLYLNGVSGPSQAADRPLNALAVGTSHAASTDMTGDQLTTDFRKAIAKRMANAADRARRRYLAAQAARRAHLAAQRAAAQQAKQQARQQASAQPSASPAPTLSGGSDPAHSALGVCIRNAEEGGSYAWGPGNGGGAYQFALGTWESYGGAASEFGVAGPAYQDQIFDNAINAGGASNWTAYDGC